MSWAITAAVVMAGTTAMSIKSQNEAAEAQQEAAVSKQTLMNQQYAQEQQEIQAEAAAEMTNVQREALRERASMRAAQAESGVAGVSPLRELANVYMQSAFETGTIISKEEAELRSSAMKSQQTQLETQSAVNQAESSKSTGLDAALQIGLSAAGGYFGAGGTIGGGTVAANKAFLASMQAGGTAAANQAAALAAAGSGFGSTQLGYTLLAASQYK